MLLTDSVDLIGQVEAELTRQMEPLPRKEIASKALANSKMILLEDQVEFMDMVNHFLKICVEQFDHLFGFKAFCNGGETS